MDTKYNIPKITNKKVQDMVGFKENKLTTQVKEHKLNNFGNIERQDTVERNNLECTMEEKK